MVGVGSEKVPVAPRLITRYLKLGRDRKTFLMGKEAEGSGRHPRWGPSEGVDGRHFVPLSSSFDSSNS